MIMMDVKKYMEIQYIYCKMCIEFYWEKVDKVLFIM